MYKFNGICYGGLANFLSENQFELLVLLNVHVNSDKRRAKKKKTAIIDGCKMEDNKFLCSVREHIQLFDVRFSELG